MERALSASWDRSPQRCPASRHALLTTCCYVWRPGFDFPSKSFDSHGCWDSFKDQGARTFSSSEFLSSSAFLKPFRALMQTSIRLSALISSSSPLSQSRFLSNVLEMQDDVVDRRWSWSSVMERDELVGRMSLVSRLPQY